MAYTTTLVCHGALLDPLASIRALMNKLNTSATLYKAKHPLLYRETYFDDKDGEEIFYTNRRFYSSNKPLTYQGLRSNFNNNYNR